MKNLILVFVVLIIASCATTKTSKVVITPTGNWDYSITGTPEGDFKGVMSIVNQDDAYTAKMNMSNGEIALSNFTWNEPAKKVTGQFNYSGYAVFFDATMAGEEMLGSMSVEGQSFPFKATRKQ